MCDEEKQNIAGFYCFITIWAIYVNLHKVGFSATIETIWAKSKLKLQLKNYSENQSTGYWHNRINIGKKAIFPFFDQFKMPNWLKV